MNPRERVLMTTLVVLVTLLGAAWALVSLLPVWLLKGALIVALASLPLGFWAGWRMGGRDAKMFLSGLDKGTKTVIRAGDRAMRPHKPAPPEVKLPDSTRLEIVNVQPAEGEGAVEL